jgi:hypothetical protein
MYEMYWNRYVPPIPVYSPNNDHDKKPRLPHYNSIHDGTAIVQSPENPVKVPKLGFETTPTKFHRSRVILNENGTKQANGYRQRVEIG